jgi:protocatechuate 3,4-dioxygenase alpha subunit
MARLTPFQTVGPYLHIGLRVGLDTQTAPTSPVVIRGRLLDGKGAGIPDGLLEWWHPSLTTMHRSMTGEDGAFLFEALKPPAIDGPDGSVQAPHFAVRVLARGILTHYMTRLYFADDPVTAADPILKLVPEDRRQTLLAQPVSANDYRFDVVVQGQNETVFFDI